MMPESAMLALTPQFVLRGVAGASLLMVLLATAWAVGRQSFRRELARLIWADVVWAWLVYCAAYHWVLYRSPEGTALLGGPGGLWVLSACVVFYPLLRLPPLAWGIARSQLQTPLLAAMLAGWAFAIGAGYAYLGQLEQEALLLRTRPQALWGGAVAGAPEAPGPTMTLPLRRALGFSGVQGELRGHLTQAVLRLENGTPFRAVDAAKLRLQVLPALQREYALEQRRLHVYQLVQLGMLATLMLLWGFGRMPEQDGLT